MTTQKTVLTSQQREQFLTQGSLRLSDCFTRKRAQELTDLAWTRLGYTPQDPANASRSRVHMPAIHHFEYQEFAPKAWEAICEVMGGEERILQPSTMGDSFIINFADGAKEEWIPPSAHSQGWHKDGDWFLHFLDSPEQGLLVLILWSDIEPKGGGTFAALDSVAPVSRFLAQHPEGIRPGGFDFPALAKQCNHFVELTGSVGDVFLVHPYILHASSYNHSGKPRFLTNPCVRLKEPMDFARQNPEETSLVEQAILRGLGVQSLAFQPTSPRERIVPERERIQAKMKEEEMARLAMGKTLP